MTTMNIYTDATKDLQQREFRTFENYMNKEDAEDQ